MGVAWVTDEVVLDERRHKVFQVRDARCIACKRPVANGQYLSESEYWDRERGEDVEPGK